MEELTLKVEHLTKYVKEKNLRQTILNDISFRLSKGEFVSIMGPSGSGKSSLLYALTSLEDFDEGEVTLFGERLSKLTGDEKPDLRNREFGFVFQKTTFLEQLTLLENIVLPASLTKKSKKEINKRAVNLMKEMGISQLRDQSIFQVSGGELQRAGICRALINNPKIIFADEPTGSLNSKNADIVMDLLKKINEAGTSILLVTHDPKVAMLADRLLFMLDGRIHKEIKLKDVKEDRKLQKIHQEMEELGI